MSFKRKLAVFLLMVFIVFLATGLVSAQSSDSWPLMFHVGINNEQRWSQNLSVESVNQPPSFTVESLVGDWVVDTLVDEDSDGECAVDCTLREAIELASSGDTIIFDDAIAGGTITYTGESWDDLRIYIDKDLTIDNSNHIDKITIDGNDTWGIFRVNYGIEITLNNLAIENGSGGGGGIYNDGGTITLYDCSFDDNGNLSTSGGSIYNSGQIFIHRAIFSNNSANEGGAIYNTRELEIHDSFFENNLATNRGGAIYNSLGSTADMYLTIDGSTFSGNGVTNFEGGAIYNNSHGLVSVSNSTFFDNTANNGGGIFNSTNNDDLLIVNSTFSGNTASTGAAGVFTYGFMKLYNSILANSNGGVPDCGKNLDGGVIWDFHNLIETNGEAGYACGTPYVTSDPALGVLQDNGGNTLTMALGPSSPAIDAGASGTDSEGTSYCTLTDQRGVTRPQGSECDIGAYEVSAPPSVLTITRVNKNPTNDNFVTFEVIFSTDVTGVDQTDFNVNATGVSGAVISGSGGIPPVDTYTVTVNTGTGIGTLGLNLYDNDTIISADTGVPLGGTGVGNGSFTDGEIYTIDSYPSFRSHPVTDVNVTEVYTYEIETQDPDLPDGDTLTVSSDALPVWLNLTDIDTEKGTATLSGTPSSKQYGSYDIRLYVTDSLGLSKVQEFTLVVNRFPRFTSAGVTSATVGESYIYNVTCVDNDGDNLTITAPTKPGWLTLTDYGDGTALLTGVPVGVGSDPVTLRVSDGNAYADQSFSIIISEPVVYSHFNFMPLILH